MLFSIGYVGIHLSENWVIQLSVCRFQFRQTRNSDYFITGLPFVMSVIAYSK